MSGPTDVLRQWARRGAERLASDDDRLVALACVVLGAAAIRAALPKGGFDETAVGASFVARHFLPIAAVAAFLAVVPKRWHFGLQSAALAALFVAYQLDEPGARAKNLVTVAMWAVSILLVWKLPLKRALVRKSLIVLVTSSLPLLARRLSFEQGVVLIQFLFACGVVARRDASSFLQCQRATSSLRVMMPPGDLLASNRSGASLLRGAALIAGGLAIYRLFDRGARCDSAPFYFCAQSLSLSIADQVWVQPRLASIAWAAVRDVVWLAGFALQYAILTGLLNLIGVPMRFITGNILRVRNLFDYWKIANRWQYELLRTVYLDDFFAIGRGWIAALGIVVVFLVSGLLHLPGRLPSSGNLASLVAGSEARWLVFGVLCAGSYQWMVYSVRRRVRASLTGAQPSALGALLGKLLAAPQLFVVLSLSGLLIAGDEVFGLVRPYWIVSSDGSEGFRKPHFYESLDYGGPIRPAERIGGAATRASPAVVGVADAVFAAWQDARSGELRWARQRGGLWSPPRAIEGAASTLSPALGTVGRRVYAAWTVADGGVAWAVFDGGAWSLRGRIDASSAAGPPTLAAVGDRLYAAWAAKQGDHLMWATLDGNGWSRPELVDRDSRGSSPVLGRVGDRLYAAFQGVGRQRRTLWWTSFDGRAWSRPQTVPGAEAASGPAITELDGRLVVAWRSAGLDADIQWASFDGVWQPRARTGLSTCDRPALASHRGTAVFAWRGNESSRCPDPSNYGGEWDLSSVNVVDVPRSSSDPRDAVDRFVWYDLKTTDPGAAVRFYGDVVGWRAIASEGTFKLTGPRGALGTVSPISGADLANGVRPFWAPTVMVADVDQTTAQAVSAGGKAYVLDHTRDGVRYALIGDRTGAVLNLAALTGAATLHDSSTPGDVWGTLFTTHDGAAALSFYRELFGWQGTLEPADPSSSGLVAYTRVTLGRRGIGTLRVVPEDAASWWLFYAEVVDLDAAIRRALAAGGKLWFGPTWQSDGGRAAELVDPQGAPFGLHQTWPDTN